MLEKKTLAAAAAIWVAGLLLLILVDFGLRQSFNTPHALGMPEEIWFGVQAALAVLAVGVLVRSLRGMARLKATAVACAVLLAGGVFYVAALWLYVVGTGVDSV